MKRVFLVQIFLSLFASFALAQATPAQDIGKLVEAMGGKFQEDRMAARQKLVNVGLPAEDALVGALESPNYEIKIGAMFVLGEMKSSKAVPGLLNILISDKDPQSRKAAFDALVKNYSSVTEYFDKNPEANATAKEEFTKLKKTLFEIRVEKEFLRLIPDNNEPPGFYEAQFDGIRAFGPEAVPVVVAMVSEEYDFKFITDDNTRLIVLRLAIESLEVVGGPAEMPALEKIYAEYGFSGSQNVTTTNGVQYSIEYGEAAAYALYKLGKKDYIQELEKALLANLETNGDSISKEYELASLYTRTGRIKDAIAIYEKHSARGQRGMNYNLACLYAVSGEKQKGLEALARAITDDKYDNYEWLMMDGDMKPLMDAPQFEEIVRPIRKEIPRNNAEGKDVKTGARKGVF